MFFDYDRIEFYDEETEEDRFDTIGDTSAGNALLTRQGVSSTMIGDISRFTDEERKELERARRSSYRRPVCGISGPETTKTVIRNR